MSDIDRIEGAGIVAAAWAVTGAFAAWSVAAVVFTDALDTVAAGLDLGAFAAGIALFMVSFAQVVGRSRHERIDVVGVYFLVGSAPSTVRRHLLGALAIQVVVAVLSAAIRPYTRVAFGVLVPMLGLALCGLWAARHGTFPAREG